MRTWLSILFLMLPLLANAGSYMEHVDGSKATSSSFQSDNNYPIDTAMTFGTPASNGVALKWISNGANDEFLHMQFAETDGASLAKLVISDASLTGTTALDNSSIPSLVIVGDAATSFTEYQNSIIDTSGGTLTIQDNLAVAGTFSMDKGTGVGQATLDGSTGGCIMLRDTDDAGWTECDALDGTLSCSVDADGVCD